MIWVTTLFLFLDVKRLAWKWLGRDSKDNQALLHRPRSLHQVFKTMIDSSKLKTIDNGFVPRNSWSARRPASCKGSGADQHLVGKLHPGWEPFVIMEGRYHLMFNVAEVRQDVHSGSRLSRGLPNRLQVGECSKLNGLNFSLQVSNIFKVWPGGKIRYKDYC